MIQQPTRFPNRLFYMILLAGLALRVWVFFILTPQNNDAHYEVVRYIHRFAMLPDSSAFNQSWHPPLYYVLASLFMYLGGIKVVQVLSLILSCATLGVMARLLRRLPWIDERLRPWCLALPAIHPQFVQYTLFISNDTLAIFLGTLIFLLCWRSLERPTAGRQLVLALAVGLGLATKFTFLAFIPPVALLILLLNTRQHLPWRAQAFRLAAALLLIALPGAIKPLQNMRDGLPPLVNNLDFDPAWAEAQRPVWTSPASMVDVNLVRLIRHPVISVATAHSLPLIFYGSFWYAFIPESSFRSNLMGYRYLGSVIYLLALPLTVLILAGALRWTAIECGMRSRRLTGPSHWECGKNDCGLRIADCGLSEIFNPQSAIRNPQFDPVRLYHGIALLLLVLNMMLIEYAGWKYNIWSVFQARLFFPSYFALLLFLHEGLRLARRWRPLLRFVQVACAGLAVVFFIYYGIETRLAIVKPVSLHSTFFPAEVFDMKAKTGAN